MPIKLPKGFSRRKSSAAALEEVANPPQPSFRVFDRPTGGSKSFDGGIALKRMSQGRPLSSPSYLVDENLFDNERDDSDPSHRLVGDGDASWSPRLKYGRGSGGTHHSSSTGVVYDTSSSSARFSSTSTLPSSTDVTPDEPQAASSKALPDIPLAAMPDSQPAFSVRAAGRTFSFGRKAFQASGAGSTSKSGNAPVEPRSWTTTKRERAMTESSFASASTATPPKLLDADLNLGGSDLDGFGKMFENFERKRSRALDEQDITLMPNTASPEAMSPSSPAVPPKSYSAERSRFTPSPINIDRTRVIDSSPYSWGSHDSHDGLMSASTPPAPFHSFDPKDSPPVPPHGKSRALTPSKTKLASEHASPPLHRTGPYASNYASNSLADSDARLLMTEHPSPVATRLSAVQTRGSRGMTERVRGRKDKGKQGMISTSSSDGSLNSPSSSIQDQTARDGIREANAPVARYTSVALFDSEDPEVAGMSNSWRGESTETTPRAKKLEPVRHEEPPLFDPSLTASATLAAQYNDSMSPSPTKQGPRHKVMTPAEFERYRQQQEMTRTKSTTSRSDGSEDGSDVDYDDDDETERNRQAARQRRKQEAHLAVYRQQMMKVTGEQPKELPPLGPNRSGFDRNSNGTPTISNQMPTVNSSPEKPAGSRRSSDDEDEDVPLGILAAHGFPSKQRPPSHLGNANPKSVYRASIQSIPSTPGSVAGESTAGAPRSSLPVFARNLPQDPYYGASLVNPSNREFLNNGGGSVYGGPQPSRPPGGLVGVIAGEERARAMRRGSPNAQGVYGPPATLEPGMPQMYPGMPQPMAMGNMSGMNQPGMAGMPSVPAMHPSDQAQLQMTQQMAQMMQVQMQWMQQMMQMQGIQPNGQPLPSQQTLAPTQQMTNNNFLSPPGPPQRPLSMESHMAQSTRSTPKMNQRAMSMLDAGMSSWDQPNGRKSTLSPSVSGALGNQGYAPSIAPSERSNVGMPSRYRPVSIAPEPESKRSASRTSTFTSGTLQAWTDTQVAGKANISKKAAGKDSDEDDDEGWEEMRRKRENKKSTWRLRKSANGLQDMYYPGT